MVAAHTPIHSLNGSHLTNSPILRDRCRQGCWGPNKGSGGAKPPSPQTVEPNLCPQAEVDLSNCLPLCQVTLLPSPKPGAHTRSHLPPTILTGKTHPFSTWSLWQQTWGHGQVPWAPPCLFNHNCHRATEDLLETELCFSTYLTTHVPQFSHSSKMDP